MLGYVEVLCGVAIGARVTTYTQHGLPESPAGLQGAVRAGDHPESKVLVDRPVPRRPLVLSLSLLPLDLLLGEVPDSIECERVDTERVIGGAFGGIVS